jgi:chromosome segregation ATPase
MDTRTSVRRAKRKTKAHMEDVMIIPLEVWHDLGRQQSDRLARINALATQVGDLEDRNNKVCEMLANLEKDLEKEKAKRQHLEQENQDLQGDLKWERERFRDLDRRFEGLLESRQNLAEAASSTGHALREVMLLLDVSGVRLKKIKKDKEHKRR